MNCDYVQEQLSAFLDREESPDNIDRVLLHLYGCENCQTFFSSVTKLRSLAGENKVPYPVELDDSIGKQTNARRKVNPLSYRLGIPVYVVSAAAVVLLIISFVFGYTMQQDAHRKELDAIMNARQSGVIYSMPTQVVYPVAMREAKGEVR